MWKNPREGLNKSKAILEGIFGGIIEKTEGISRIISWEARENANLIWIEDTNKQAQSFKLYLNWIFGSLRKKCFGIASLKVKETCGGISREARGDFFFLGNFKKEFSVKLLKLLKRWNSWRKF